MADKKEFEGSALFISLLVGIPFSAIPGYTILALWMILASSFSRSRDEHAWWKDYPICKKLVEFGWEDSPPTPQKWHPGINESKSEQEVSQIHEEAMREVQEVTESYVSALKQRY